MSHRITVLIVGQATALLITVGSVSWAGTPTVVDSAGLRVGPLIGSLDGDPCPANVLFRSGRVSIAVAVSRLGIELCSKLAFLHDTDNCTGAAYLPVVKFDLAPRLFADGTVSYYPAQPYQITQIRSRQAPGFSVADCTSNGGISLGNERCCLKDNQVVEVGKATTVDLSQFQPPFRIR
jgi:hypothetical protein